MREYEHRKYKSSDGEHECYCVIMRPDGDPKGILQISHGMCEYIDRYLEFMSYLADHGYVVCGNDHLGHGRTAKNHNELGYFGNGENGWKYVLNDIHRMTALIKAEYPGVPLILLGHSMGSFLARAYAVKFGSECAGFIFMGTADAFEAKYRSAVSKTVYGIDRLTGAFGAVSPKVKTAGNKLSAKLDNKLEDKDKYVGRAAIALMMKQAEAIARVKGDDHRSKLLLKLGMGNYNDRIKKIRTGYEWLSRDDENVKKFAEDPLCNYHFTVNGWLNIAEMMWFVSDERWYASFPKKTPTLLIAGMEDPVGNYGKGVRTVFRRLRDKGCNVSIKLYEGARHELLEEINREEVFKYLAEHIDKVFGKTAK